MKISILFLIILIVFFHGCKDEKRVDIVKDNTSSVFNSKEGFYKYLTTNGYDKSIIIKKDYMKDSICLAYKSLENMWEVSIYSFKKNKIKEITYPNLYTYIENLDDYYLTDKLDKNNVSEFAPFFLLGIQNNYRYLYFKDVLNGLSSITKEHQFKYEETSEHLKLFFIMGSQAIVEHFEVCVNYNKINKSFCIDTLKRVMFKKNPIMF